MLNRSEIGSMVGMTKRKMLPGGVSRETQEDMDRMVGQIFPTLITKYHGLWKNERIIEEAVILAQDAIARVDECLKET